MENADFDQSWSIVPTNIWPIPTGPETPTDRRFRDAGEFLDGLLNGSITKCAQRGCAIGGHHDAVFTPNADDQRHLDLEVGVSPGKRCSLEILDTSHRSP